MNAYSYREAMRAIGVPIWPRRRRHKGISLSSGSKCTRGAPLCLIITQRRDSPASRGKGACTMLLATMLCWVVGLFAWGCTAGCVCACLVRAAMLKFLLGPIKPFSKHSRVSAWSALPDIFWLASSVTAALSVVHSRARHVSHERARKGHLRLRHLAH